MRERKLIPWSDIDSVIGSGGPTLPFMAGAALLVGDVVYCSAAAGVVNKTNVAATGSKFVGVVVGGGGSVGGQYSLEGSDALGIAVAINTVAQVRVAGIAWVVAGAAIVVGASVGFDTGTAGRVLTNATALQVIGIALDAAAANGDLIRILIQPR